MFCNSTYYKLFYQQRFFFHINHKSKTYYIPSKNANQIYAHMFRKHLGKKNQLLHKEEIRPGDVHKNEYIRNGSSPSIKIRQPETNT